MQLFTTFLVAGRSHKSLFWGGNTMKFKLQVGLLTRGPLSYSCASLHAYSLPQINDSVLNPR